MFHRDELTEYYTFGIYEETVSYDRRQSITLEEFWEAVRTENLSDMFQSIYVDRYKVNNEYTLYVNAEEDGYRVITTGERASHGEGVCFPKQGFALNYALAILRKIKLDRTGKFFC